MPELDVARELLVLAEDDARALEVMLRSERVPRRICGFHAQQAVGKALKAWLILLDVDYPLTHSLYTLLSLLGSAGADCARYEALEGLSPYAVQLRYGVSDVDAKVDPAEMMPEIEDLVRHVRELLDAAEAAGP